MLSNYLLVAVRNLLRHKASTIINVVGLSLGIAVCVVIMLFVRHETTYDVFHEKADDLYRVVKHEREVDGSVDHSAWQPMPVIPALKAEFPEIMRGTRVSTGGVIVSSGERVFQERVLFVDPDFFRMFSFSFVSGGSEDVLEDPLAIVITQEMASKYFGDEPAVGKRLHMRSRSGEDDFTVAAVVAELPSNSSLTFDFAANLRKHTMYERSKERWTSSNGSAFVLLNPGTSSATLDAKLPAFVQKYYGALIQEWRDRGRLSKEEDAWTMSLQPMRNVHMDTSIDTSPEGTGNPSYVYILGGIAVLVLTIACINFVTLSIGRSAFRSKEVGVRKVLGAVRGQLAVQFWGEAVLLCVASLAIGLVLAESFLPTFAELSGVELGFDVLNDGVMIAGLVVLLLAVGIAAGGYPAFYLARFEPVETLKGKVRLGGRHLLTKVLIVFQFGLSIFLMCGAILLQQQTDFLITKNLGFRPEQVVVVPTYAGSPDAAMLLGERLRARVSENRSILRTSLTSGAFTHAYDINGFMLGGVNRSAYTYRIDDAYLETLGIKLKEGRNFRMNSADDLEHGIIVNEAFVRMMEWPEPAVGRKISGTDSEMMENLEIIGVVPDFHFTSLREEIRPMMMFLNPEWPLDHVILRIAPDDVPATLQYLRSVWKELAPSAPFQPTFLDEDFKKLYESEVRWGKIIATASTLSVFLASLGLFGVITVVVSARTKEIGIRKVLGASGAGIVRLVSKEFLALVLLGNLIAAPAAWYAASSYLENYAYRVDLSPLIFVFAGAAALFVAFLAIGGHVIRAARANPVESLRYE